MSVDRPGFGMQAPTPGGQAQINTAGWASDPMWSQIDPTTGKDTGNAMDFSWIQQGQQGNADAQQQALKNAQDAYAGKGPSLATQLLQQQANRSMANQNAMASSGTGQSALARRQAMMANAGTMQDLGSQAATARAQEQLGALGLQGQIAGQARAQDLSRLGMQGSMLEAQSGDILQGYGEEKGLQLAQNQQNMQLGQMAASAGGAMMMAAASSPMAKSDIHAADLHLSEPSPQGQGQGGASHWIIREEPNFIAAINARSGQMHKLATIPLSPEEHSQVMSKHGAGPVGSYNPANKYAGDMNLGGDPSQAQSPQQPQGQPVGDAYGNMSADDYANLHAALSKSYAPPPTTTQPPTNKTAGPNWAQVAGAGLMGAGGASGTDIKAMMDKGGERRDQSRQKLPGAPKPEDTVAGDQHLGPSYDFQSQYKEASSSPTPGPSGGSNSSASPTPNLSSPPEAKTDIQPAMQTGADKLLSLMNKDPNAGYFGKGLPEDEKGGLHPEAFKVIAADNRKRQDFENADRDWRMARDLPSAQYDRFGGMNTDDNMPTGQKPGSEEMDFGISDPSKLRNLNRGGPILNDQGDPQQEIPEMQIRAKEAPRTRGVAADLHLGMEPKIDKALRKLSPYSYRYKEKLNQPSPAKPGSKYFGVMTTDLKKDPTTKNMVFGKGKNEKIAVPAATSFNLAANASLQKTADKTEKRVSHLERAFANRKPRARSA